MAFDEVRLPIEVERGFQGGPEFKTTVLVLSSGFERRNVDWEVARGRWDIAYGLRDLDSIAEVRDFFYARQGRARGFRFRDWSDFEATNENIGTGNSTQTAFQLRRQYASGVITYNRNISKPVAGTVRMFLDTVETSAFTVDTTTGIVTFASPPGNAVVVTSTFQFDVPVRFDIDQLSLNVAIVDAASIEQLPIVELRIS